MLEMANWVWRRMPVWARLAAIAAGVLALYLMA